MHGAKKLAPFLPKPMYTMKYYLIVVSFLFIWGEVFSQENHSKTEFILEETEEGYLLHCCIPEQKYNPRTLFPGKEEPYNPRRVVQSDPNKPPIYVIGSYWKDGCLFVPSEDKSWGDEIWIDMLIDFTLYTAEEIKIVRINN